jgi:hypothetical protein
MKKIIFTIAISIIAISSINAQLTVLNNGYIGVGQPNPTYNFQVGGTTGLGSTTWPGWASAHMDFSTSGGYPTLYADNGTFYIGKPTNQVNHMWCATIDAINITYTGGCSKYSDKRFKKNITKLSSVTQKLKKITSYTYNYNDLFLARYSKTAQKDINTNQIGFIAQELQPIFPELVISDRDSGYLKIDYISMVPILTQAIQEQNNTIDSLQIQLKALASQVANIQNCCNSNKGGSSLKSDDISDAESTNQTSNLSTNTSVKLYQNAPNPFKESTIIKLEIPETVGNAMVCIYDLNGRQLKCLTVGGHGTTSVQIFGNELTAGLYHYALIADGALIDTKTMVLTN